MFAISPADERVNGVLQPRDHPLINKAMTQNEKAEVTKAYR